MTDGRDSATNALRTRNLVLASEFAALGEFTVGQPAMAACAAFMEVYVTKPPPRHKLVAPRPGAEAELQALLDEIPTWPDSMLVHMYQRFGSSRLFRVHHDPQGPLTDRATALRTAALAEIERRGLALPAQDIARDQDMA